MEYNRYLTQEDLEYAEKRRDDEEWVENYPHKDLWKKSDALMKWFSIMRTYEEIVDGNNKVVVDLGAGEAPICHYIASLGNDVTGVDVMWIDHLVKQSLAKMVLKNAWLYLDEREDESIDVILDSCAVTHFGNGTDPYEKPWDSLFKRASKLLKPGGYVIISTDAKDFNHEDCEFGSPQKITEVAMGYGFKSYDEPNWEGGSVDGCPYHIGHVVLKK